MHKLYLIRTYGYKPAFEGDGDGVGDGVGDGDGGGAGGDNPFAEFEKTGKIPSALQEKLNNVLSTEKKKHQQALDKYKGEVEALSKRADLSTKERESLEGRLDELQNSLYSKEELARKDKEKLAKKHATEVENLTTDRDTWKNRYTNTLINNQILAAADANDAYNNTQIATQLRPKAQIVERQDDEGNPTGEFDVRIKLDGKDKDGKPVTFSFNADEAVKHMKEQPEHQNLFKSDGSGGLGGGTDGKGAPEDRAAISKDPAAYRKNRQQLLNS